MSLSPEDLNALVYFWRYKGDLTRWSSWTAKRPLIEQAYPEIIWAMRALQHANDAMDGAIARVEADAADSP